MADLAAIKSPAVYAQVVSSLTPTTTLFLAFHTTWATPCIQHGQILAALTVPHPPPNSSFVVLDADDLADISEQYDVASVPHIVVLRGGKVLDRLSGADALKIRALVDKYTQDEASVGTTGQAKTDKLLVREEDRVGENEAVVSAGAGAGTIASNETSKNKEELWSRLGGLVKAAPVMLFMKGSPSAPECGFSRQLVALLREREVKYGFFNILADDDVRQGLKEFSDWPTFPQLYVQGELVGGLDIVKEELENDADYFTPYSTKTAA